jgi:integrative and conjugative element protein (TIGR02256 family)
MMLSGATASVDGRETGGILLGHDPSSTGLPEITAAGDPGPRAVRSAHGFLRDLDHASALADDAYDRDGSVWVGEWHTHPGGPPFPSPIDLSTYSDLLGNADLEFERILSIILTQGTDGTWIQPRVWSWVVTGVLVTQAAVRVVPDVEQLVRQEHAT